MTAATAALPYTRIMKALDLKDLPEEEQEQILVDLGDLVFRGTMLRLIEKMDEKTKDDFNDLLDREASEEDVEVFLKKRVPDADAAVEETMRDLTADILAVTAD